MGIGLDPWSLESQTPGLETSPPRTPEGSGDPDTLVSSHLGSIRPRRAAPQALPWPGDWTDLPCSGTVSCSGVSQALGPAPGPAPKGLSARVLHLRGKYQLVVARPGGLSSTSLDYSIGPNGATCWGRDAGEEPRADSTLPWAGPAASDCTTSGLRAAYGLHHLFKEYQSSRSHHFHGTHPAVGPRNLGSFPQKLTTEVRSARLCPMGAKRKSIMR